VGLVVVVMLRENSMKKYLVAAAFILSAPPSLLAQDEAGAYYVILYRGWGKPDKTQHHDGDIRQHIISDRPLTLDEWTAKYCRA
jgi:hypothetical protein